MQLILHWKRMMNSFKRQMQIDKRQSVTNKAVSAFMAGTDADRAEFVATINRIYQKQVMTFNEGKTQ